MFGLLMPVRWLADWASPELGKKDPDCVFQRPGEPMALNFQDRGGKIKPYQAKQLIAMIDKYAK